MIYAIVFSAVIYPIGSHWVFGGGWLQSNLGMQDFAGSTAVHLIGATGALAALLLLGPRKGKYGPDGKPRAIPGHSMPLAGLGMIILFIGWFGFNAGSTLNATDSRFGEVAVVTLLGAGGGVIGAFVATMIRQRTIDIGMVANGMIAGLVAITAPSGYVEAWTAPIIGIVGGLHRRVRDHRDRQEAGRPGRRAVGARPGRYLGHAGVRHLHGAALGRVQRVRRARASSTTRASTSSARRRSAWPTVFAFVFILSFATFALIKATIGLRVSEEQEDAGLDIVEHGMYGYPEQFIPASEIGAGSVGPGRSGLRAGGDARRPVPRPPR